VVIGGKNKYMVNGHTVQQNQVQNLFHSVQLNVNNPHFLIMQGRITKVLNMKPMEILSMIEEAAGTRMFETKKQAAIKTIEKKQLKVDEITKCMAEDITPTLDNLRNERKDYHAWQAVNTEFERLDRLVIAFEYQAANEKVQSSEADRKKIVDEHDSYIAAQNEATSLADACAKRIAEIERLRGEEMEGELQELKKAETEHSKTLVKVNALHANQKESLAAEQESLTSLARQCDTATKQLTEKNKELDACVEVLRSKEAAAQEAENEYTAMREKYQNACAGVTDENSAELLSLPEQVGVWEKRERETLSAMQQCQQRATYARAQLKELQKATRTQTQDHSTILKESETLKAQVAEWEVRVAKARSQDPTLVKLDEPALRAQAASLQGSISQLRDKVDSLTASVEARLSFEFRDPEKGFDRSKVKGLVARLVTVNKSDAATALEIAAGSKLYQVVVDTETTGKLLLQKGGLRKRVTILPLNKISSRCTDPAKVKHAKDIAAKMGGSAHLALELVGCEEEVRKAMEYVFGSAIICENSAIAKAIAFDRNIRTRTVTLEGDTYDPSGTLTGGSKNQLGVMLSKIDELATAKAALRDQETRMQVISKQLTALEKQASSVKDLLSELELKRHALRICDEKMADSTYAQTVAQVASVEAELVSIDQVTQI
jgi:structural maintenance of chromosome 2